METAVFPLEACFDRCLSCTSLRAFLRATAVIAARARIEKTVTCAGQATAREALIEAARTSEIVAVALLWLFGQAVPAGLRGRSGSAPAIVEPAVDRTGEGASGVAFRFAARAGEVGAVTLLRALGEAVSAAFRNLAATTRIESAGRAAPEGAPSKPELLAARPVEVAPIALFRALSDAIAAASSGGLDLPTAEKPRDKRQHQPAPKRMGDQIEIHGIHLRHGEVQRTCHGSSLGIHS
jgi:hypothetical protein